MKNYLLTPLLLLLAQIGVAQSEPLLLLKPVADRLVERASFNLQSLDQPALGFMLVVDCTPFVQIEGDIEARATITVPTAGLYRIGFATSNTARLSINGRQYFKGNTNNPFPSEVEPGRYIYGQYAEVRLLEGENRVEVRTKGKLSFGLVDRQDRAVDGVGYAVEGFTDYLKREYEPLRYKELRLSLGDDPLPMGQWHYANGFMYYGLLSLGRALSQTKYIDATGDYCRFLVENAPAFERQYMRNNSLKTQNYTMIRASIPSDFAPSLTILEMRVSGLGGNISSGELLDRTAQAISNGVRWSSAANKELLCGNDRGDIYGQDILYTLPFLVRYGHFIGGDEYYDRAVNQLTGVQHALLEPSTGLYLSHATDQGKSQRATAMTNAAMLWAMCDALEVVPRSYEGYATIEMACRNLTESVVKYQQQSGLWPEVLANPIATTELVNPTELTPMSATSDAAVHAIEDLTASAMMTAALARAVAWSVASTDVVPVVLRGWHALSARIGSDGTVKGLSPTNDAQSAFGLGAMLMAGVAVDRMVEFVPASKN